MTQKEETKKPASRQNTIVGGAGLGTELAVAIGLFAFAGIKVDEKYNSKPWGLLGGLALAFVYGAYAIWKLIRMTSNPKVKKDGKHSDEGDN